MKKRTAGHATRRTIVPDFDREWFHTQQHRIGMTRDELASRLPDQPAPSAVTHLYAGHRRMRLDEAVLFASLFGVTLEEIARRAGAYGALIKRRKA